MNLFKKARHFYLNRWDIITSCKDIIYIFYFIYLQNIILYYLPINHRLVFNKTTRKIDDYSIFKLYNNHQFNFISKGTIIEYHNNKYYNFGNFYDISNSRYVYNNMIARFTDTIESIKVSLLNDNKEKYNILIQDDTTKKINFINSILNYSTCTSRFDILLYYYLQNYLQIKDKIVNVYVSIDNNYISINHFDTVEMIYSKLEQIIDKLD